MTSPFMALGEIMDQFCEKHGLTSDYEHQRMLRVHYVFRALNPEPRILEHLSPDATAEWMKIVGETYAGELHTALHAKIHRYMSPMQMEHVVTGKVMR